MKTQQTFFLILGFSAFVSITSVPRQAQARACSVASDCPKGFDCEPGGVAADGGPASICTSLPCQSNSDCGSGFTCYQSGGVGPGVNVPTACAQSGSDGGMCGTCVPQWDAPCTTDAGCGPGYTCPPSTGGFYDCGKDQDASYPPYDTVTTVPCSAVPTPLTAFGDAGPPPGFPAIPAICDAGSTCTAVTWNTCTAQQTGSCTVDSDCPSTWTCGCQASCGGVAVPTGSSTADAGCTMACIPPNSDLVVEICGGAAEGPSLGSGGGSPSEPTSVSSDSGVNAAGPSGSSGGSSSSHGGGCQIGSDSASASWSLIAAGVLAAAGRRLRRRCRVTDWEMA
jgi:hypothetical protein